MKNSKYNIGSIFKTDDYGNVEIKEKTKRGFIVKFLDYDLVEKECTRSQLLYGRLQIPNKKTKYEVGYIFSSNFSCDFKIIEKINRYKIKIKFLDEYGYETYVRASNIHSGVIYNPYKKNKYGSFLGEYEQNERSKKNYIIWSSMFTRVNNNSNYKNVSICDEWYNFSNFNSWCIDNYPYHIQNVKFNLDKDLLQIGLDNKIYSPTTCVFLPSSVNSHIKTNPKDKKFTKINNKYKVKVYNFKEKKELYIGSFEDLEFAKKTYIENKKIQHEHAKQYLRDLNYLEDKIIELVGIYE